MIALHCISFHDLQEAEFRHRGNNNGFFGSVQHFTCDDKCGLFVPLHRLSPNPGSPPTATGSQHQHSQAHTAMNKALDHPLQGIKNRHPPKPQFQLKDRVTVYNKYGEGVHGKVKWTDSVVVAGQKFIAVGIRLVSFLSSYNIKCNLKQSNS